MKHVIVRAAYRFEGESNEEIAFDAGDLIAVTGHVNADWSTGYLLVDSKKGISSYKEGRFPRVYCNFLDRPNVDESADTFLAIRDATSGIESDLQIHQGDLLVGEKKLSKTHWNGRVLLSKFNINHSERGLFCEDDAVRIDLSQFLFAGETQSSNSSVQPDSYANSGYLVTSELQNFNEPSNAEVSATQYGNVPIAPAETDSNLHGNVASASYTDWQNAPPSSTTSLGVAVCTTPFTAQIDDELTLYVGDRLEIMQQVDDIYYSGHKLTHPRVGIFPMYCVKLENDGARKLQTVSATVSQPQTAKRNGAEVQPVAGNLATLTTPSAAAKRPNNAPPPIVSVKPKVTLNDLREQQLAAKATVSGSSPNWQATSGTNVPPSSAANANNPYTLELSETHTLASRIQQPAGNAKPAATTTAAGGSTSTSEPPLRPPPLVLNVPKAAPTNPTIAASSKPDDSSATVLLAPRNNVPLPPLPVKATTKQDVPEANIFEDVYEEINPNPEKITPRSTILSDNSTISTLSSMVEPTNDKLEKMIRHYLCVVSEICDTERRYLVEMSAVARVFLGDFSVIPIDDARSQSAATLKVAPNAVKPVDTAKLFGNLDEVVGLSSVLMKRLDAALTAGSNRLVTSNANCMLQQPCYMLGECFNALMSELGTVYGRYCRNHEEAIQLIEKYKSVADAQRYIEVGLTRVKQIVEESNGSTSSGNFSLDLQSMLIKPVQRVLKYPLLLKELLKDTLEEHPDRPNIVQAVQDIERVAEMINEQKRCKELVSRYRDESGESFTDKFARLNTHTLKKKSSRVMQRMQEQLGISHGVQDPEFNSLEARFNSLKNSAKKLELGVRDVLQDTSELLEAKKELLISFSKLCSIQLIADRQRQAAAAATEPLVSVTNSTTQIRQSVSNANLSRQSIGDASLGDERIALVCDIQKCLTHITDNFVAFRKRTENQILAPLDSLAVHFGGPMRLIRKRADKKRDYDYARGTQSGPQNQTDLLFKTYSALNQQLKTELPPLIRSGESILLYTFAHFVEMFAEHSNFTHLRYEAVWNNSSICTGLLSGTLIANMDDVALVCAAEQQSIFARLNTLALSLNIPTTQEADVAGSSTTLSRTSSTRNSVLSVNYSSSHQALSIRKQSLPIAGMVQNESNIGALVTIKQTDDHRRVLADKYGIPKMCVVTKDYTPNLQACELDLPVSKDDWVAVIKDSDPTGNRERCFVDSGVAKGFIARNLMIPLEAAMRIAQQRTSQLSPSASSTTSFNMQSNVRPSSPNTLQTTAVSSTTARSPSPNPGPPSMQKQASDSLGAQQTSNDSRNSLMASGELCYAIADFSARSQYELSLTANQPVLVLRKTDDRGNNEWWLVRNETGQTGYIPSNFVEKR